MTNCPRQNLRPIRCLFPVILTLVFSHFFLLPVTNMPITPAVFGLATRFLYHVNHKRSDNFEHNQHFPTSKERSKVMSLNCELSFTEYIFSNQAEFFNADRLGIDVVVCKVWFWDSHGIVFYKRIDKLWSY